MPPPNPCLSCGACCAFFRVSFHWSETTADKLDGVPEDLTLPVSPHFVAMRGTHGSTPRCTALDGEIGCAVACRIHPQRSSTCRNFEASWSAGKPNPDCDRARARYNLAPLSPADWLGEPLVLPIVVLPIAAELAKLPSPPPAAPTESEPSQQLESLDTGSTGMITE